MEDSWKVCSGQAQAGEQQVDGLMPMKGTMTPPRP
jgi:hypothetical protein